MNHKSLEKVRINALKFKNIYIVGASFGAEEVARYLLDNNLNISCVMHNGNSIPGINGITVISPIRKMSEDGLYIVTAANYMSRKEILEQLNSLGINEESIFIYYPNHDWFYHVSLSEDEYEDEIKCLYKETFGKELKWNNPQTYNEIINKEKLFYDDSLRTMLADKVLARQWVSKKIGEQYLTKHIGIFDKIEDVNFDELPDAFVLKLNNASGRNIVVKNKKYIRKDEIINQFNEWLQYNFAYYHFEMQYKNIEPKVVCEEYLPGLADNVYDYNIYCFHGQPQYIWCINGSHKEDCKASFYDLDWNMQEFSFGYPKDEVVAPRPKRLDEMLELTRILCKDFVHVRVDWYNMPDGRLLFGEMTFSTWGGNMHFDPEKYDLYFGKMINEGSNR